jgi:hypothetical protein
VIHALPPQTLPTAQAIFAVYATAPRPAIHPSAPVVMSGWIRTGQMYDTWIHDPAINNGCNEWDSDADPNVEHDNQGNPCVWLVP